MLKIENLSKSYKGGVKAVDNLSLHIQSGEIYGFIGHNGAGKTTTLKAICGILDFEDGDIFINGIDIKKDPIACKKLIAYIPDNPDLYENIRAIEYLNFICDIFKVDVKTREERISKYAKMFEIEDKLGDLISSFSHGMKQKIALISALIHDPKLIVLDEPFVGLDPKASYDLKLVMREFCDRGAAIFFSTHVLEVASKLCDKIAIIKAGKLIANGNTDDITKEKSLEEVFLELK